MSAKRGRSSSPQLQIIVEPPRFDRPEIEIRASSKRTKTGNAHWSGSRIIVQIPSRLRGTERQLFVDELVERLLQQRPESVGTDASLDERARALAATYNDGFQASTVRSVSYTHLDVYKRQQQRSSCGSDHRKPLRCSVNIQYFRLCF